MKPALSGLRRLALILMLALIVPASHPEPVRAQAPQYDANCNPRTWDDDTAFQAELCSAHVGCRMVFGLAKICGKVKSFFNKIGSLFSRDGEIDNNDVFDAATDDLVTTPAVDGYVGIARNTGRRLTSSEAKSAPGSTITSTTSYTVTDGRLTYVESQTGKPGVMPGSGTPTVSIGDDGRMVRGLVGDKGLNGIGEIRDPDGTVRGGYFSNGKQQGNGFVSGSEGGRAYVTEGVFADDKLNGRATTTFGDRSSRRELWEGGTRIAVGPSAPAGQAPVEAVYKSPAQLAAEEEQAFAASIAKMGPGELFAKADELRAAGKLDLARQTLRSLVSRFPNSPLAATAAQQLSGFGGGGSSGTRPGGGSPGGGAAPSPGSPGGAVGTRPAPPGGGGNYRTQIPDPILTASWYNRYTAHNLPLAECKAQANGDVQRNLAARIKPMQSTGSAAYSARAAAIMLEFAMVVFRQCEQDPQLAPVLTQLSNTRRQTIQTCRQVATGPSMCTEPWE
ncbi:hypothetical protein [Sphingomonas sp.]|uniref:hypothetical protein n=1 Tax=Sphingomonas sp. TaxID=28214 RepID=UPI001EB18558|nr:hypothetical protein [Sphingomonas sp.]MBX3594062.1 hypothetical protein [Sphingomonas sp.]